jgi:hypothetical protein
MFFNFKMTSHLKIQVELENRRGFKTAFKEAKHDKLSFGRLDWIRFYRVVMVCSSLIAEFRPTLQSSSHLRTKLDS